MTGNAGALQEQLQASDAAGEPAGRVIMVRTYTFGPEPANKQLSVTWSDNRGFTWVKPQKIIASGPGYYFAPRIAVDKKLAMAVWQQTDIGGGPDSVFSIFSGDGGVTWGRPFLCAGLKTGDLLATEQKAIAAGRNGFACAFTASDGNTRKEIRVVEFL